MISKIIVGNGWTKYKTTVPVDPGDYYEVNLTKKEKEQVDFELIKKQLGLKAVSDPYGRFHWLCVYADWIKWALTGVWIQESSTYGKRNPGAWDLINFDPSTLYPWQRAWVEDCVSCTSAGFQYRRAAIVGLGGGKSLPALLCLSLCDKAAVVAPRHVHSTWRDQAAKWNLPLPILTTYESCHRLLDTGLDGVAFDEILTAKNPEAIRSEKARSLSQQCTISIGLTGTPTSGGGPLDWRWLDVIRPGSVPLDAISWQFLFNPTGTKLKEVKKGQKAYVSAPDSWDTGKIASFIGNHLMRVDTSSLLAHLPAVTYSRLTVAQPSRWETVVRGAATERGSSKRVMQARTISDGFIYNDQQQVVTLDRHKVMAAADLFESTGEPIVFLAAWRETIDELKAEFTKRGYSPAVVSGDTASSAIDGELERFKSGATDVLILNARYGAGIDGLQQRCRIMCFVSWSTNPTDRKQAVARIYRPGQSAGVQIIDIVAEDSLDDRVLELISGHNNLSEAMVKSILAEDLLKWKA